MMRRPSTASLSSRIRNLLAGRDRDHRRQRSPDSGGGPQAIRRCLPWRSLRNCDTCTGIAAGFKIGSRVGREDAGAVCAGRNGGPV